MKTVNDYSFSGKRALIRVDFNVPLNEKYQITDDTRIKAALPTLEKIRKEGGSLVLMSHLGRPKGGYEEKYSLAHLVQPLSKLIGEQVLFAEDCIGEKAYEMAAKLRPGQVLLLENLRFYKEEEKGDADFAEKLSKLGNVYVNDAFGTAHRAHASTAVIADFFTDKMVGYIMQAEIENADKVLKNAEKPFVAIMGGSKISDKILIIEQLLDKVDYLLIGGAMSYTFCKALGGEVGNSLVEADKIDLAKELMEKAKQKNVQLLIPKDSVAAQTFNNSAAHETVDSLSIPKEYMGLDIGKEATQQYHEVIAKAKTILWNGPMGVFEMSNFAKGTIGVAKAVVEATQKGAFSLIGGGDSAAAINQLGFGEQVSYVSTGGGALLEYMEGKVLPGVKALL